MNEIEKAIVFVRDIYKAIDPSKSTGLVRIPDERVFNLRTIITALQEQVERSKGCEHCRGWDKRCGASYCPMCGKRLEEHHEAD